MIIWGSKARQRIIGNGVFFCPNCRLDSAYQHIRVSSYFTLYFIPLFPMSTLGEGIQCGKCGSQFNMSILELSREQIMDALQPWVCAGCSNHNPASERTCLACGRDRPSAGPPPLPSGGNATQQLTE